jgi:hypothetical protein
MSAFGAEESLRTAEEARNNDIRGVLTTECNALHETVEAMRCDNESTCKNLSRMRDNRDDVDDNNHRLRNDKSDLERIIDDLHEQAARDQDIIAELRDLVNTYKHHQTLRRRKHARRRSQTTSPSRSGLPSAHSSRPASRPDSPMAEDRSAPQPHPGMAEHTAAPQLLTRIAMPASTSGDEPTQLLTTPLLDVMDTSPSALYAPTPFIAEVGFFALLPIIIFDARNNTMAVPGTATLNADGSVDYHAHSHFILATGRFSNGEPAWRTTLIRRARFLTPQAVSNCQNRLPMPLAGLVLGGRNGMLISPEKDPKTEGELEAMFTTPARFGQAQGYTEWIRFTPPELRGEFHSHALERWQTLKAKRRNAPDAKACRQAEPSPHSPTTVWRRWLKETRELPQSAGTFKYIGIPLVGQGYQTAHIDGARAILSLVPLSLKGFTMRGPLREAILCHSAALLCVPEQYTRILAQIGQTIAPTRLPHMYDEAQFGKANTLDIKGMARFMASVGITAHEAEQWRPWAAAYIEMELEERPTSAHAPMLTQARDSARARIDSDTKWAFTKLHPDAPGNYNPERDRICAVRLTTTQAEVSAAGAGPSNATRSHPDEATEGDVDVNYDGEGDDEDNEDNEEDLMGPV